MIAIGLFAALLVVALFVLLARYSAPKRRDAAPDWRPSISVAALRALTVELLRAMKLEVADPAEAEERYLIATKREPIGEVRYLVALFAAPVGEVVDRAAVLAFAESVKSEHAIGMLMTPGTIESAGLSDLDVSVALFDGPRFRELVAEHLPHRLGQLDRCKGFNPPSNPAGLAAIA